jgi:hypothetical protein
MSTAGPEGGSMPEGPSAAHDARVLSAAREAAARIRERRPTGFSWRLPVAALAGLAVGLLLPSIVRRPVPPVVPPAPATLTLPARMVTRGSGSAAEVPVEQAPADAWYQYIEQLLAAGELPEAERHLRRFVELHPDYRPPPR